MDLRLKLAIGLTLIVVLGIGPARSTAAQSQEEKIKPEAPSAPKETQEDTKGRWALLVGTSNVYPKLEESEATIDRSVNASFGRLLPAWKNPDTFKDWRDDSRLWDLQLGLLRDLNDRFSWFIVLGGATGTIRNGERYFPWGLPMKIDADFTRSYGFVSTGFDFYPWRRPPALHREPGTSKLKESLQASRPFLELATSYLRLHTVGDVQVSAPVLGELIRVVTKDDYDLIQISPRIGLETPVTKKDSVILMAGYFFFTSHEDEFNGPALFMVHKHRFGGKPR